MFPWRCLVGQGLGCTKGTFNRQGWGQPARMRLMDLTVNIKFYEYWILTSPWRDVSTPEARPFIQRKTEIQTNTAHTRVHPSCTTLKYALTMKWSNTVWNVWWTSASPFNCFHILSLYSRMYWFQAICAAHHVGPYPSVTHVWVVVHHQQVLGAPLWARPLISSNKPGDVVMLQQRQPVYGAFIKKILPVGCREHFHSYWPFIQGATVDSAVASPANELEAVMEDRKSD